MCVCVGLLFCGSIGAARGGGGAVEKMQRIFISFNESWNAAAAAQKSS